MVLSQWANEGRAMGQPVCTSIFLLFHMLFECEGVLVLTRARNKLTRQLSDIDGQIRGYSSLSIIFYVEEYQQHATLMKLYMGVGPDDGTKSGVFTYVVLTFCCTTTSRWHPFDPEFRYKENLDQNQNVKQLPKHLLLFGNIAILIYYG